MDMRGVARFGAVKQRLETIPEKPSGGWRGLSMEFEEKAEVQELTKAASQKCIGSCIPAPPRRMGRQASSHWASDTDVPKRAPQVTRNMGETWLAVHMEVNVSTVRKTKLTLMPLKHLRRTRLAEWGSPKHSKRDRARCSGARMFSVTQV